ncbi:hypothetical protein HA052_19730 [Chromobacterium haemolyticum]|uniref:Uncharacterized protein n=1 Tax=Chromobacterium fluminis TaxID=3044269 RepID=A0ABX0LG70_9NEIS|nr:hypothetical protein [Chromobacterium haemolyticum]NHR07425.1 hypothetical protein [Chromobacterium haemolyticum]
MQHTISDRLAEQIAHMVRNDEDWIPDADGVNPEIHVVINYFDNGVWLCAHNGECFIHKFERTQRLA